MAAYPNVLPTCVDGSLGRTKSNALDVEDLDTELDAPEFNVLASSVEGLCATIGIPNAAGIPTALAVAASSGFLQNPTTVADNVLLDATSGFIFINGVGLYTGLTAQTKPSVRWINFADTNSLVPFGYPTSVDTITGGAEGEIVGFGGGLYLLLGDGAHSWTLIPATNPDQISDAVAAIPAGAAAGTFALRKLGTTNVMGFPGDRGLAAETDIDQLQTDVTNVTATATSTQTDLDALELAVANGEWVSSSSYTVTPATLLASAHWWLRPDISGTMVAALPPLPIAYTQIRDVVVSASSDTVTFVLNGGTGTFNGVADDFVLGALGARTLYRLISTTTGHELYFVGVLA